MQLLNSVPPCLPSLAALGYFDSDPCRPSRSTRLWAVSVPNRTDQQDRKAAPHPSLHYSPNERPGPRRFPFCEHFNRITAEPLLFEMDALVLNGCFNATLHRSYSTLPGLELDKTDIGHAALVVAVENDEIDWIKYRSNIVRVVAKTRKHWNDFF